VSTRAWDPVISRCSKPNSQNYLFLGLLLLLSPWFSDQWTQKTCMAPCILLLSWIPHVREIAKFCQILPFFFLLVHTLMILPIVYHQSLLKTFPIFRLYTFLLILSNFTFPKWQLLLLDIVQVCPLRVYVLKFNLHY
jgi:hypothetical protein